MLELSLEYRASCCLATKHEKGGARTTEREIARCANMTCTGVSDMIAQIRIILLRNY